jgi:hypothetical protein
MTLNEFIAATVGDLDTLQAQLDGQIETWYGSYTPTLSNKPAVDWQVSDYPNHVGDLFYDNSTGKTYQFNDSYLWEEIESSLMSEILSMANASQDTADSKRRVFVVQPTPPYDVGDIWWTANELYRCRLGKQEGDVFAQTDWINDLKYTDDTTAISAIAQLDDFQDEVTQNYATTSELYTKTNEIVGQVTETKELIKQTNNDLTDYKDEVSSKFTQQANNFELSITEVNSKINETRDIAESNSTKEYLRFSQGTGVEIGATNSDFKVNITNQEFNIQQNGNKVAYVNDKKLYITEAEILQRQYLGNFAFVVNTDGSLSLRKVRGE